MDSNLPAPTRYDEDFSLWIEWQIEALRARAYEQLDLDRLLEELEGILGSAKRELRHRLQVLTMHLLKCQFQPERKSASWRATIAMQRFEIEGLLEESPSLRRLVADRAQAAYRPARSMAALETQLPLTHFPEALPYSVDQLLDPDYVP